MSDQDDNTTGFVIAIVLAVVAFVITGVLGLAIGTTAKKHAAATMPATAAHAAPAAAAPAEPAVAGVEKIFFETGAEGVPASGAEVIVRMAAAAKAHPESKLLISGFHDATGDAAMNAELAKKRAQAVQQALEAAGVAATQLELDKPAETTGGANEREARRVELKLR